MGWNPFASEEETRVATQVSRVVPDDSITDPVQASVVKAIFNDGNVSDYVLEDLITGLGQKVEEFYRYGESRYFYGLPSGSFISSTQGRAAVEAVIETLEGQQVLMDYSYFGPLNPLHVGWIKLLANYQYNPNTNQLPTLTATKGTTVWLKDMVVVVPKAMYNSLDILQLEQWGIAPCAGYTPSRLVFTDDARTLVPHSPIKTSTTATGISLLVTYTWEEPTDYEDPHKQATFSIPVSADYDLTADYFQAKYVVNNVTKYWLYKNKMGTYPTLDDIFVDAEVINGTYFPITYFRFNKASTTTDKTTQAYITSNKMMKILGMDYETVAAGINENPSIGDVEQAMMIFAVPPTSTDPVVNRYLFDYFDNMHDAYGSTSTQVLDKATRKLTKMTPVNGRISETHTHIIKDKKFQMAFTTGVIFKRMRAGTIGAVGTYTSVFESEMSTQTVSDGEGNSYTADVPIKVNKYRHQLIPGIYEEIVVTDLKMTYYIWGGYTTTGNDTSEILLIPLDHSITKDYTLQDRSRLYAKALHFVFNSRTTVEVDWYQQGWFQVFLVVVAIYFTVQSGGSDGGKSLAWALGLEGTAAMIAIVIFDVIFMGAIYAATFRLFVKLVGQDVATLVAIAAMVYAGYQVSENGMKAMPTAERMLMISNGLQQSVLAADFADLLEQANNFKLYADEQTKLLDQANELLANQNLLSPFVIFGEKPEDYFNRTVHYGNIGTLGITAVSSYVDIALTLPKVQDTLGEEVYG